MGQSLGGLLASRDCCLLGGRGSVVRRGSERVEQLMRRLGRQVLVVVIVELQHRRVHTRAQTFDLGEAEELVRRRPAGMDAQVLLDGLHDAVRIT